MRELAEGVFQLSGFPPNAINIYVIGDVLVDAGTKFAKGRILRQLKGRTIAAHALTHAHPDHQGASHAVCEALDIPLFCGEGDAETMETGDIRKSMPKNFLSAGPNPIAGPAHPVSKRLKEGDEVGGFTVIETAGHSPGHVSYWRESDRVLIAGDVLFGMNIATGINGLHQPPKLFTVDPAQNRESIKKAAALRPDLICFGHGKPQRDPERLAAFAERL